MLELLFDGGFLEALDGKMFSSPLDTPLRSVTMNEEISVHLKEAPKVPSCPIRVLWVGAGGLGCTTALVMAKSAHLLPFSIEGLVVDDDVVSAENLHRQWLYQEEDIGQSKAPLFAKRVEEIAASKGMRWKIRWLQARVLPENALSLIESCDLVIEGADNFSTKFLVADAARLAKKPVVHAGVVRWFGYALASGPEGKPCLRCLFEDIPRGRPDTCAISGVVGPLVALVGALQTKLAIELAMGIGGSTYIHLDALRGGSIRRRPLRLREDCPGCAPNPKITSIREELYLPPCEDWSG
ncbi:MAG: HesA/MoeB/ThiF family protein [Deltaproteobacteria bacterium]|nr:HesA/MoeB/ThiF family protein [Deltaproteobacteria bacterium]